MSSPAKQRDDLPSDTRLRITEVFHSIQGESRPSGCPTVFVRLTGCPLRCVWCDTEYSFHGGQWHEFDELLKQVAAYGTRYVCVTGGEPLAQPNCAAFLTVLCDAGYDVSLETSGALDIEGLDERVTVVMDLKAPGSGEVDKNRLDNLDHLRPDDQIKIVVANEQDYTWAKDMLRAHSLADKCAVLLSPGQGVLDARQLAEWILADQLPVRFQVQLHKYLWGDEPGH